MIKTVFLMRRSCGKVGKQAGDVREMEPLLGLSQRRVSRCTACPGYSGAQPEITPQRRRVETLYNRLNEAIHRHRKFTRH